MIVIEIDHSEDMETVALILINNRYKVWVNKIKDVDMGGMAGSTWKSYLCAEELNPSSNEGEK